MQQILRVVRDAVHHGREVERRLIVAAHLGQRRVSLRAPLRLVEQPRVLERDPHARRDRRKQPHVGVAEGVLALVVLERR